MSPVSAEEKQCGRLPHPRWELRGRLGAQTPPSFRLLHFNGNACRRILEAVHKVRRGRFANPSSRFLILLHISEHVLIGIGILHVGDGESNNGDLVVGVFHIK